MASNIPMMSIVFVFLLSLSSAYSSNSSPNPSNSSIDGFTLELIPPYSPKSPLFIPNLTSEKRMQMMMQHSHERAKYLTTMFSSKSSNSSEEYSLKAVDTITQFPIKQLLKYDIVVEVGIGTFGKNNAYKSYFLTMDTGSGLIWTQCESCQQQPNHCYPQLQPYFPFSRSKTYKEVRPPRFYKLFHEAEGTNSSGILAIETFTVTSSSKKSSSKQKKLDKIVFGCGRQNFDKNAEVYQETYGSTYPIAGVFGIALSTGEDHSFLRQVENKIGGRFSYCLIPRPINGAPPPPMYLKFGSDIKEPRKFSTIPLYIFKDYSIYAVKLEDLGVNGERLNINKQVFSMFISRGPGGLLLDTGSEVSYIVKPAFDVLEKKIDNYFANFKKLVTKERGVCYTKKNISGFTSKVPHVSFYFEGGIKLDLDPQQTFNYIYKRKPLAQETFCLSFIPKSYSLLGALQQVNHKFIYNVKSMKLQFANVDCAKDG